MTDPNSDEHQHLIEALIGMEKVAEHINEMQRIHEEYGAIFDHLFRQHQKSTKQVRVVTWEGENEIHVRLHHSTTFVNLGNP